ncbi:hypothetical protein COOONC_20511 [Cooperia oncophora]
MAARIAVLFLRPLQMWLGSFFLKNASDYKTLGTLLETCEPILHEDESLIITSDASYGLGCNMLIRHLYTGLTLFRRQTLPLHHSVQLDNTTAVWYINKKGGTRNARLKKLTRLLWLWASKRDLNCWPHTSQVYKTLKQTFFLGDRTTPPTIPLMGKQPCYCLQSGAYLR